MKKSLLIFIIGVLLAGCSKVPQEDFNKDILQENDKLKNDMEILETSYASLKTENEESKKSYHEYLNKYGELLAKTNLSELMGAWGKTAYGENVTYGQFGNNAVQLNVIRENITYDVVREFYDVLVENIALLSIIMNSADYIYIRLLDIDNVPVIEYFINQTTIEPIIAISIGFEYNDIVTSVINDMVQ